MKIKRFKKKILMMTYNGFCVDGRKVTKKEFAKIRKEVYPKKLVIRKSQITQLRHKALLKQCAELIDIIHDQLDIIDEESVLLQKGLDALDKATNTLNKLNKKLLKVKKEK